jgi:hypothetical protein
VNASLFARPIDKSKLQSAGTDLWGQPPANRHGNEESWYLSFIEVRFANEQDPDYSPDQE